MKQCDGCRKHKSKCETGGQVTEGVLRAMGFDTDEGKPGKGNREKSMGKLT
jgi:hypothetical protein